AVQPGERSDEAGGDGYSVPWEHYSAEHARPYGSQGAAVYACCRIVLPRCERRSEELRGSAVRETGRSSIYRPRRSQFPSRGHHERALHLRPRCGNKGFWQRREWKLSFL